MNPPRQTSPKGIELIKAHEGCRLHAYLCPAKVWTIGYGHTGDVTPGLVITQPQADALLKRDLRERFEPYVNELVRVPINQNMFDALVSLTFNIGVNAFRKSTLLRLLNERRYTEAAAQFQRWNKGGGRVLTGLVRRRAEEANLFLAR